MWKSEGVSLVKAPEEVKKNFELQSACLNFDIVKATGKKVIFSNKIRKSTEKVNKVQFKNF